MTPTPTPTINGLRLVRPEECGYRDISVHGNKVESVLFRGNRPIAYILENDWVPGIHINKLIPLPKPRTTRPFKRGKVKCGDVFRRKGCGCDYLVTRVRDCDVFLGGDYGTSSFESLHNNFLRLTYDSEGREVLSEAGVTE